MTPYTYICRRRGVWDILLPGVNRGYSVFLGVGQHPALSLHFLLNVQLVPSATCIIRENMKRFGFRKGFGTRCYLGCQLVLFLFLA